MPVDLKTKKCQVIEIANLEYNQSSTESKKAKKKTGDRKVDKDSDSKEGKVDKNSDSKDRKVVKDSELNVNVDDDGNNDDESSSDDDYEPDRDDDDDGPGKYVIVQIEDNEPWDFAPTVIMSRDGDGQKYRVKYYQSGERSRGAMGPLEP